MAAIIGTGITVTYQTGLFAEILDFEWGDIERAVIETTHMGTTGGRTYMPGSLYDPGGVSVELIFDDPDGAWITAMAAAAETVTCTLSNSDTWAASAFMHQFAWTGPLEDRMTATARLKASGSITLT